MLCLLYGPGLTTLCAHWKDHSLDHTDLCQQSNVSAFQHTVQIYHSFPAKKQLSSDFRAAVAIHSDFRAQEKEICHYFHFFPFYLLWNVGPDAMIFFFFFHKKFLSYLFLSWLFYTPPSPTPRGSLVPLCFLPLEWHGLPRLRVLVYGNEVLLASTL